MVSIEMLPAAHGDAIWIEYGTKPDVHRILIDGGPVHTYESGLRRRVAALKAKERQIDLMVVTHIDADHIDGALVLLQELEGLKLGVDELWFNGWPQLPQTEGPRAAYAPLQGEFLGGLIQLNARLEDAWNRRFGRQAVVVSDAGDLPVVELEGDARLILLGPSTKDLRRLRARWASAIRDFSPGDVEEARLRLEKRREYRPPATPAVFAARRPGDDRSAANGSSICFVFECEGLSVLFAGDARAPTLAASLKRLAEQSSNNKVHFDVVKLPHHGSMGNVSDAWLQWVDCQKWLISTNGDVFDHPDVETARLIAGHVTGPALLCNYQSDSTERLRARGSAEGWITNFPEGKTVGPVGGLQLRW